MYLYVVVQDREAYYRDGPNSIAKVRLEAASGERCLIVPYQEFNLAVVNELRPRAVVMSGFGGHFEDYDMAGFRGMSAVMHEADLPLLGLCGSHQLLGFAFNRDLRRVRRLYDQPMRRLPPASPLPRRAAPNPACDLSAFFVADGFYPVTQTRADPLFAGLPRRMMMRCSHYCEVKRLPPGFVQLATGGHCRIEAMRHRSRPVYGTQFHPEKYEAPFCHGRTLLANFAQIVAAFWRARA